MALVPWHTAAYAETYLTTKEPALAESVYQMADWLCGLQHERLDPRHPLWVGGFMTWADGRVTLAEPQVGSASFAEALAEACRVAAASGDPSRYRRYREALERCLQFLTTLQYTDANCAALRGMVPAGLGGRIPRVGPRRHVAHRLYAARRLCPRAVPQLCLQELTIGTDFGHTNPTRERGPVGRISNPSYLL